MRLATDDGLDSVAELGRRYFELYDQVDRLDGRSRKVAVLGQLARLGCRIAAKAGPRCAIVSGFRVMVPIASVESGGTSYRIFTCRDIDVESFIKYESDLVDVVRRHVEGRAIKPEECRILATEVRIATGANPDEAEEVLDRLRVLGPEAIPADVAGFKAIAASILSRCRTYPAFTLPGEDF